jgi:hypothetical protein
MLLVIHMSGAVAAIPSGRTEHDQAVARLAVVALAEMLAAAVCWAPLAPWWTASAPWRTQCVEIANWTTASAATVLGVAFVYAALADSALRHLPKVAETVSILIFSVNLLSLTTAVTRTGGVGDSFYVPLLSVLLTLVLVFELQKELIGSHSSWTIWLYAIATAGAWTWAAQKAYAEHQDAVRAAVPYQFRALWTWLLTLLGILVAVLGYLVPRTDAFRRRVTRAREKLEQRAAQTADP